MANSLDRTAELMTDADFTEVSMNVNTILVPTDGSATAVEATRVAIGLARCFDAEVVALFVSPGRVEDPMEYASQEEMEGVRHSEAGLLVAEKMCAANGVRFSSVRREGAVGHEIIAAADAVRAQWIVMGTEGRKGFKRLALGSIAESIVKESRVPVTVVRHCSTEFCMTPRG